jgi:hypothetical protein
MASCLPFRQPINFMSSKLILASNLKYVSPQIMPASFFAGFISFVLGMFTRLIPTIATSFSCKSDPTQQPRGERASKVWGCLGHARVSARGL